MREGKRDRGIERGRESIRIIEYYYKSPWLNDHGDFFSDIPLNIDKCWSNKRYSFLYRIFRKNNTFIKRNFLEI